MFIPVGMKLLASIGIPIPSSIEEKLLIITL